VADGDPERIRRTLSAAGLEAAITPVPATIEERMMLLARAGTSVGAGVTGPVG
jgi:ABC-2 type transport system ATP-binding protein/ribosome-dependent ATPase